MLKFDTMINRACKNNSEDREQANKLYTLKLTERSALSDSLNIEEYKQVLDNKGIEYVEAEFENKQGKTVHIVIPSLVFKSMTHKDIDKLFKV